MISTWAILVASLTVVSALSNTVPASDVQRVVSHLQAIMPLHAASVSERFKRQVQNESGTSGDQPPPPPPPPPPQPMHAKYLKCCKKMPKIINMKSVRECSKSLRRPAPPQGNPGGPPPPTGTPSGPPPTGITSGPLPTGNTSGPPPPTGSPSGPLPTGSTSGPPPPTGTPSGPPPTGSTSGPLPSTSPSALPPPPRRDTPPPPPRDSPPPGEKDVEEVETLGDAQNTSTTGKLQHRPGGKASKGGRWQVAGGRRAQRERMACAMECAFEKENLIKDGVVDQTAFAAYVDKYIQEKNAAVWKDAIGAALKNCSVSVPASTKRDPNCKSGSLEMVQCMDRQIFEHCPDSNWKRGNSKCDTCRAAPQNCSLRKGRRE